MDSNPKAKSVSFLWRCIILSWFSIILLGNAIGLYWIQTNAPLLALTVFEKQYLKLFVNTI